MVDDGSDMPLSSIVQAFADRVQLTLVHQANAGPARARNAGAARAAGALLAFTDDDCEPRTEWLSALWAEFLRHPDAASGGHTVNALPANAFSEASQLLVDFLCNGGGRYDGRDHAPAFFTSNNFAVPANLFRQLGGFDESFRFAAGEDREFCGRWRHLGHRMIHAQQAVVMHSHVLSLRSFVRQHFNYGRGACHLRRARDRHGMRGGFEPLAFYGRLVTYPLRVHQPPAALKLMLLMGVCQVANTVGFVFEHRAGSRYGTVS